MGSRCWFEYVRSAANVADAPSRLDLAGCEWDCGLPGEGLLSSPVPVLLPGERDWADRAAKLGVTLHPDASEEPRICWQCPHCLRGSRSATKPPSGRCTRILRVQPEYLRELGHRCMLIDFSDASFVCICQRCGCFTSGARLAKLGEKCAPLQEPHKCESWRLLSQGRHPKRSGVTVDLSTVCPI